MLGQRKALREFLHVDDLANACLFILRNWSPPSSENSFINVGTGKDITIKELAELISEATDLPVQFIGIRPSQMVLLRNSLIFLD